jgi:hypothetical protein
MADIYNQLRYTELNPELAAKLWPFIQARRPHEDPPTWRDLQAQGLEKIEEDSLMDIIEDQYLAEKETESEEECAAFRTFA